MQGLTEVKLGIAIQLADKVTDSRAWQATSWLIAASVFYVDPQG